MTVVGPSCSTQFTCPSNARQCGVTWTVGAQGIGVVGAAGYLSAGLGYVSEQCGPSALNCVSPSPVFGIDPGQQIFANCFWTGPLAVNAEAGCAVDVVVNS